MSTRNLQHLFRPRSVAVIGASNTPQRVGTVMTRNLLSGGFSGPIMPVNPKHQAVAGVLAYPDVDSLPLTPDLAVICTPPTTVLPLMRSLAARGTRAAIVVTAGLGTTPADDAPDKTVADRMLEIARSVGMRVLGPNCLGLLVPGIGLNASFAHQPALDGRVAFVSQSGALCTAVLDWATPKGIGFSHFISTGDALDIDFGDLLDYLGSDPRTRAILLYIESIKDRRGFFSAARAAARNKPVLAIKSGRVSEAAAAAASHTGALAGSDAVYDAAFRRSGMLRVYDIDELFAAVETLGRVRASIKGDHIAIVTNGGGIGVMAVDELIERGGTLATLSDDTMEKLNGELPGTWSHANPVDIIGDAPGERYARTVDILMQAPEVDAVIVMLAPTAIADPVEAARAVIEVARRHRKPLVTSWVGEGAVAPARRLFSEAAIPSYDTPTQAVQAVMHLISYHRSQEMLMEVPPSAPTEFTPATQTARLVVEQTLASGRDIMTEPEAKAVLAAYGIPTVETHIARTPEEAAAQARKLRCPVALKILSPDITHKSDVGGVVLDLSTPEDVEKAGNNIISRVQQTYPEATINGFTVQPMARRPGGHELIVGMTSDPIFGPVLLFGQGGTAVEVIGDRAVALPPLNMGLAQDLIERTRIYRLLQGYRDRSGADLEAIKLTLIQISQLIVDVPEIVELDINPLFADEKGVLAVDARIRLETTPLTGAERLAITPYPKELEETMTLRCGRMVLVRPIRPEDEPNHHVFVSRLTPEDIRFRFFGLVQELPHSEMARLTQIDYDREMAFIAVGDDDHGQEETLGVVRTVTDSLNEMAEFSIIVRSDIKGQGLGPRLLDKMIRYCRERGTQRMVGQVLADNRRMLQMVQAMGFERGGVDGDAIEVSLKL